MITSTPTSTPAYIAWQLAIGAVVLAIMAGGKTSCSTTTGAESRAVEILERDGYTDATTTGVRLFTCGKMVSTGFDATSPSGVEHVTGSVCCGAMLRGCEIITD